MQFVPPFQVFFSFFACANSCFSFLSINGQNGIDQALTQPQKRPGPAVGRHDAIRDLNGRNEWTQKSTGLIQG